MSEAYWLIERGSPAEWWVSGSGGGNGTMLYEEWTRDASKAMHLTEWGAHNHAKELEQWGVKGPLRATEHIDCAPACDSLFTRLRKWHASLRRTDWTGPK